MLRDSINFYINCFPVVFWGEFFFNALHGDYIPNINLKDFR